MENDHVFCTICGAWINFHDGTPLSEDLPWSSEVRAIRTRSYVHDAFVTGVGYLNSYQEVIADRDEALRYTSPEVQPEAHRLRYASRAYWAFPIHDACWLLLLSRVDPDGRIGAGRIAQHLFSLLYNTPTDGSRTLRFNHNYRGAVVIQQESRRGYPVNVGLQVALHLRADPSEEFDFDPDIGPGAGKLVANMSALEIGNLNPGSAQDGFKELPSEIVLMILEGLPSSSVSNLRLASRYVAAVSHTPLLPQSFWASRFTRDNEMGFTFASRMHIMPAELVDWRQLYINTKTMLMSREVYPGLYNRFRIWQILDRIVPAIGLRLANEKHISKSPYSGKPARLDSLHSKGVVVGALTYEYSGSGSDESQNQATVDLVAGCRLFERQFLSLSKLTCSDEAVDLGVSLVTYDEKTHVCGFRLITQARTLAEVEHARVGFINMNNEQLIRLNAADVLERVAVHTSMSGIVGLRFDITGQNDIRSESVGNIDILDTGSGIAQLTFGAAWKKASFLVGIDACKMVSFQLLGQDSNATVPRDETSASPNDAQTVYVWNPSAPPEVPDWHPEAIDSPQSFNLCLDMDFGGSDGQLLRSLSAVNVFMGEFPRVFFGMSFVYVDGTEKFYGRREEPVQSIKFPCVLQTFPLSGEKGELINKVEIDYDKWDDTIQELMLSTNFGRSKIFRLRGAQSCADEKPEKRVLTPAPNKVISALCVKLRTPVLYIRDLAVRCVDSMIEEDLQATTSTTNDSHSIPLTKDVLVSANEMMAHAGGHVFDAANVEGLRTIRVSSGKSGYSRGPQHISGIQLEYEDTAVPLVLGQWIHEVGLLELAEDERLIEISTWHDFTNRYSRVKLGPTVKLRFVTSKGVTKEFPPGPVAEGLVYMEYRENLYQELHGFLWGCNYQWDHVRVLYRPRPPMGGKSLIYSPAQTNVPEWVVRDRVFLQEVGPDGGSDAVNTVEVSFKFLSSVPSGITFSYMSGRKRTLGALGEKPLREELQEDEKLTVLNIGVFRNHSIGSISFHTDKGRELVFVHEKDRLKPIHIIQRTERHILQRGVNISTNTSTSTSASASSANTDGGGGSEDGKGGRTKQRPARGPRAAPVAKDRIYEMPSSAVAFAGLWTQKTRGDGSLKYPLLGPIFEAESVE
ncbi:hypothetical protein BX600DRAFT_123255 [Xylariales sp. PMI_506]|nr:hypothetical protein BX600DRAFT_123255 [Xylariales sp. PMI_506]